MKKIFLSLIISTLLLTVGCSTNKTTQNISSGDSKEISQLSNPILQSDSIADDKIWGYIESDSSWATEPTPQNLIIDSYSVVKIKVLSVDDSKFIDSLNYDKPLTPINVEVVDVLSGNNLSDKIQIHTFGGTVLISDLIEHQSMEITTKMEIDKMSKEKQSTNYIKYTSDSDYILEVGKEYVVILDKQPNEIYTIAANGYGIFESQDETSKSQITTYKNVLTDTILDLN